MYPAKLKEGLVDEDEGDEEGEDLLGEAGDEADQEAPFKGYRDDDDDDEPEADPDAARQVLHILGLAELRRQKKEEESAPVLTATINTSDSVVVNLQCKRPLQRPAGVQRSPQQAAAAHPASRRSHFAPPWTQSARKHQ